ncbi:MAG: c-type cytochrome [Betaproteobacteria bacterium]
MAQANTEAGKEAKSDAKAAVATTAAAAAESATKAPDVHAAVPAAPNRAALMARGQQIAGVVCVACHGLDGMSAVATNPNIAGMPEQYIARQLDLFKSGTRKNAIMQGMAANLTAEDMKALGTYYFSQRAKVNAVSRDAALATRGQKIYRAGIPELKVPACAGCHGGAGAGIPAIYPRLAGQWPEYTLDQLKAYTAVTRKNTQMNAITARMRESNMQAVAEYIAGMRTR